MPQFQSESWCTNKLRMLMQIKLISLTIVEHQDSLRNRDKQQLGNGPFGKEGHTLLCILKLFTNYCWLIIFEKCWCPQTMKWQPCSCPDPILRELKAIIMLFCFRWKTWLLITWVKPKNSVNRAKISLNYEAPYLNELPRHWLDNAARQDQLRWPIRTDINQS